MLRFIRIGAAGLFQTSDFPHGQKGCGFLNRAPILKTLFAVGLLSFSPTIAQSQVLSADGAFWKMEQLAKSPECISLEQAKDFINYAEGKLFQWRDNTMVYDDHDNSLETQGVKELIDKIKQKICPPEPVKLYHVGVRRVRKQAQFPLPPSSSTGADETQKRIEIGSSRQTWTGFYLGGELAKNWGRVRSTETWAATGAITNQFSDSGDPIGGGVIIGYKFVPWANNIVVSPFASFDFLHAAVNHTFVNGSYLGTTANFMGTFGVKAGPQLDIGLWLYGIAGVSVLNETLNINFIPVSSSQSAWVTGATVGLGGAWQPAFLQGFGRPVSLFLEYQHTWWQSANFNTPAASPLFNYNFARQDDVVKFGFTVSLAAPPPPPTRGLITK